MKHIIFPLLLWTLSLLAASTVAARGPEREKEAVGEKWHGRSIYFIVTDRFAQERQQEVPCSGRLWCGGTFNGIVNNLDYIQGMGFDAIWITPPVKQVPWMVSSLFVALGSVHKSNSSPSPTLATHRTFIMERVITVIGLQISAR